MSTRVEISSSPALCPCVRLCVADNPVGQEMWRYLENCSVANISQPLGEGNGMIVHSRHISLSIQKQTEDIGLIGARGRQSLPIPPKTTLRTRVYPILTWGDSDLTWTSLLRLFSLGETQISLGLPY